MNNSKELMVSSNLLAISLIVSLAFGQASVTATEIKPVQDTWSPPPTPDEASKVGDNQLPPMAPGVVLVGLKPGVMVSTSDRGVQASNALLSATFSNIGVKNIEPVFAATKGLTSDSPTNTGVDLSHIYRLRLAPDADVLRIVQNLSVNPAVMYAEPDYLAHIVATPDDPLYSGQWGLTQIDAPTAWDVITGTADVVIAVVDSGLDTSHLDLAGQLWVNPGEIAGNSVDDDNNGHVDDIHGWNIVEDDANLSDNTGHGTQVAGVIAATTDNGEGVAGVCWGCRLMVVKVTQPSGVANYSDIAAGVAYAAQKGAEVINLSLGGYSDSATLQAAIATASQTAVVVGGAGNDDSSASFYPAAYDDYVLAVAGATITDTKVGTSNYGMWVDVSAPGGAITTTFSGGGYGSASGTSMAAPFASGLAGLLRSLHPAWSPDLVRAQIVHTTADIDGVNPGYEGKLGNGRIDAGQAVTMAAQPKLVYQSHAVDGETDGKPEPGSTVDLDVTLFNEWADATNVQATLNSSDSYVTITVGTAPYGSIMAYESETNAASFGFSVSSSAPYAYDIPMALDVTVDGGYTTTVAFTVTTASGIEHVSGVISSDTTWTNDKTYVVDSNIGVQSGVTLTIEAGTVVKFDGDHKLQIQGTLIADGTPAAPIVFTFTKADPEPWEGWDQIQFDDSSADAVYDADGNYVAGSILRYTRLEHSSMGISCNNAAPFIDHNTIVGSEDPPPNGGIWCHFYGGGSGSNLLVISNNTVYQGDHVDVLVPIGDGRALVTGNYFMDTTVDVFGENTITFTHNALFGDGGLDARGALVAHNLIAGVGLHLERATAISNTVVGNSVGPGRVIGVGGDWVELSHNNIEANQALYDLRNYSSRPMTATHNWWGTTNTTTIDQRIYDQQDDINVGLVSYVPMLNAPEQDAPAYLYNLALTPDPVGIETITFDLIFSRPMDPGVDPFVTFGVTEPYTNYTVLENSQWITDTIWRATYDITSLVPRGAYTVSVSGARGTDGMEIPTDTRFDFTVDYAGEITDQTPPDSPWVIVGGKDGDASIVEGMWSATDPDSSITAYRYAIGSTAGATDIVNWTTTSSSSIARSGLGLVEGQQYWLAVQARNEGGLWSASGYSAFVAGQSFHRVLLPLVIKNQ